MAILSFVVWLLTLARAGLISDGKMAAAIVAVIVLVAIRSRVALSTLAWLLPLAGLATFLIPYYADGSLPLIAPSLLTLGIVLFGFWLMVRSLFTR